MIFYLGNEEYYNAVKNIAPEVSVVNDIESADKVIVTEYSDGAVDAVKFAAVKNIPAIGIEDGFLSVLTAFGAESVPLAEKNTEGCQEWAVIDATSPVYMYLESVIKICRAKPFTANEKTCPASLDVMSRAEKGEILAMRNKTAAKEYGNIYAVNFNLLSNKTPDGIKIISNFIKI